MVPRSNRGDRQSGSEAYYDQRWYGLKYFGKRQDLVLGAEQIRFFGGLEADVRNHLRDRYTSIEPVAAGFPQNDAKVAGTAGAVAREIFSHSNTFASNQ
jgi:hypothetical protein